MVLEEAGLTLEALAGAAQHGRDSWVVTITNPDDVYRISSL